MVIILVLNWNSFENTCYCVESLQKLDFSNFEIVIIDNASQDGSCKLLSERFPNNFFIKNSENYGFGKGMNKGIQYAISKNAEYVWLINNDAIVDKYALRELVWVAQNDEKIGIVGSVVYRMRDLNLVEVWGGAYVNLLLGSLKIHQKKVSIDQINYITGCSMLIRVSAIIDVGYFDEKYFMYWEDTDISFSFQKKGWKLAVADDSKVWHQGSASLGGEGSLSKQIYTLQSAVIFFSKFSKYPRLTVFLYFLMKSIGGVIKRKDLFYFIFVIKNLYQGYLKIKN